MNERLESVLMLIIALACILVVPSESGPVEANGMGTVYIRADGSVDPSTAPVSTFDNVTYTFAGNISASVVFGRSDMIVDGNGYTVQGAGGGVGFTFSDVNNITLKNVGIDSFSAGISLSGSSENGIMGIRVGHSEYGIWLESSSNNTICGSSITNNMRGMGLLASSNNSINGNSIANSVDGIDLNGCSGNSVAGNNITENKAYGVWLAGSSDNTLSENWVTGTAKYGIYLLSLSNGNSISGNNITNNNSGIGAYDSSGNIIRNNSIARNGFDGIFLSSSNNSINENNITNNGHYGLYLLRSSNNSINGNNITNNQWGFDLEYSSDNLLRSNVLAKNTYNFGVHGSDVSHYSNNVDTSNTVDDKPVYYWVKKQGMTVPADAGYLALVDCRGTLAQDLNLTNNIQGVLLAYTTNTTIAKSSIMGDQYGIWLYGSYANSVIGNNVTADGYGMELHCSLENTIAENNITANSYGGIRIRDSSNQNCIIGNNIADNHAGIQLEQSSNNSAWHNNFTNNTDHTTIYDNLSANAWDSDYPSGGNYWSGYSGSDSYNGPRQNETGYDWIGDVPYVIDGNNRDRYPLTHPFVLETEELRFAYRNLLLKYNEMRSGSDALIEAISGMQEQIDWLNSSWKELHEAIYDLTSNLNSTVSNLQSQIDSIGSICADLDQSIRDLKGQVDALNSTLQTSTSKLQEQYNSLRSQLDNSLIITYIIAATTVALVAVAVYLGKRKARTSLQGQICSAA